MDKSNKTNEPVRPIQEKKNELEEALKKEKNEDAIVKAIKTLLNKDK